MLALPAGEEGDKAFLESPEFKIKAGSSYCVMFWYMLYGSGAGELRLHIKYKGVLLFQYISM